MTNYMDDLYWSVILWYLASNIYQHKDHNKAPLQNLLGPHGNCYVELIY